MCRTTRTDPDLSDLKPDPRGYPVLIEFACGSIAILIAAYLKVPYASFCWVFRDTIKTKKKLPAEGSFS